MCCVNTFDTCPGRPARLQLQGSCNSGNSCTCPRCPLLSFIDPLQADTVRHSKDSQPPFARIPAPASPQVEPTLPSTDWEILWGGGTARCITCRPRTTQLLSCFAYTIMPEGSTLSPLLPSPVFTASSCVMEEAKVQNGMKTGQMWEWDGGRGRRA